MPEFTSKTEPRRFYLQRTHDVTGVSGTGRVADGVLWPDGTATVRWRGERSSTVHWDRMDDAKAVHGHGGATLVVFTDEGPPVPAYSDAWRELTGYVLQAIADGGQINPQNLSTYMNELRHTAMAPVREWMEGVMNGSELGDSGDGDD